MKAWIVRFAVLLVFNIAVLLVIGWLTPARVGWSAIWAGIVLTLLTMWVRPVLEKWFAARAAKSSGRRTKGGDTLVEVGIVLAIAFLVWVPTVLLTGVRAGLNPFAYILPPIILAIGWWVYEKFAARAEAHAGALYDRATGAGVRQTDASSPALPPNPATEAGRRELKDGLTDEQRRMLDELG